TVQISNYNTPVNNSMSLWLAPSNVYTPFSHSLPLLAALSELDDALLPHHDPLVHRLRSRGPKRPRQWTRSVDLRGFEPSEVSVKRDGCKMRIAARHEDGEDVTEVKRTIDVPEDVDVEKLSSGFTREGILLLQAPFKEELRDQQQQQLQKQKTENSVWDELRELLRAPDISQDSMGHVEDVDGGGKRFCAELSVREFKPEEIRVRQQGDCVLVEAEHKEEAGGQRVYKKLERIFQLPDGTKLDQVASKLSHDGRLTILAPFEAPPAQEKPHVKDLPMETEQQPPAPVVDGDGQTAP
ncbi:hypothetical protein BOX15_Mlig005128g1, partial [Macrostomum lignano]